MAVVHFSYGGRKYPRTLAPAHVIAWPSSGSAAISSTAAHRIHNQLYYGAVVLLWQGTVSSGAIPLTPYFYRQHIARAA